LDVSLQKAILLKRSGSGGSEHANNHDEQGTGIRECPSSENLQALLNAVELARLVMGGQLAWASTANTAVPV
jgi:hypothetical protein